MNPNDNRYRVDKDTNVQDPDYVNFPLHGVISKHRKVGGRRSKAAHKTMDKWVDLATGHGKDPFEGMYVDGAFDFENGDESDQDAVLDLEKLVDALEKSRNGNSRKKSGPRFSHAWGD